MSITVPGTLIEANFTAIDPVRPVVVRAHARRSVKRRTASEIMRERLDANDARRASVVAMFDRMCEELASGVQDAGIILTNYRGHIAHAAFGA